MPFSYYSPTFTLHRATEEVEPPLAEGTSPYVRNTKISLIQITNRLRGYSMLKEFKEFALKGSLLDLAIGFIIGGAFGAIVTSLVEDVIMPPIGLILGGVDFNNLFIDLSRGGYETLAAAQEAGAPTLNYGAFTQTVLDFVIIALVMFAIVKAVNAARREKEEAEPEPDTRACTFCLSEVPLAASRCSHCTAELEPVTP